MIENIQPRTLVIGSVVASYTKLHVHHSSVVDEDAMGKAFWTQKQGSGESAPIPYNDHELSYRVLYNLTPDSQYTIKGTFYDTMVDEEILAAKQNVSISDPVVVRTAKPPRIVSVSQEARQVDIGVTDPIITVEVDGDADSYVVAYSTDQITWNSVASGSTSTVAFSLPMGTYYLRVRGRISLPASGMEDSAWYTLPNPVVVEGSSSEPNPPTSVAASVGRIQATFERYDVRLSWNWDRGDAGNITEFIIKGYPAPNDTYIPTGNEPEWDNPSILTSSGTNTSTVLVDIMKDVRMFYRVEALGYDSTAAPSDVLILTVSDDNVDDEYVKGSGVEVTYSHILAYTEDAQGSKEQTFKVDAATGSVAIGKVDPVTGAPIKVDAQTGQVHVQGHVIADTINSASFVMTQLSASDRPNIRTNNKTNYGDGEAGLYMGYNADTLSPAFQFEMGNTANYLKWDGENLRISGSVRIEGPQGDRPIQELVNDTAGRIFNQPMGASFTGTTFSDAAATTFVTNLTGFSEVSEYTIVTQYNTDDPSKAISASWEGGVWNTAAQFINGNLISTGTIYGDMINSNSVITGHIDAKSLTFHEGSSIPPEIDNNNISNPQLVNYAETATFTSPGMIIAIESLIDGSKAIGSDYAGFGFGPGDEYLQADLGSDNWVAEVRAYFYATDGAYYRDIQVDVFSEETLVWDTVYEAPTSKVPKADVHSEGMIIPTVIPINQKVRFIRLRTSGDGTSSDTLLYELEILSLTTQEDVYEATSEWVYPNQETTQISSASFVTGVSGWRITNLGNAEFNNATFRGHIEATSGTFSGSLNVKSATSGSRIEIVGDQINVYEGNALRVRIGRL